MGPKGWLQPLARRVQQNPSVTVYPKIDSIQADNFRLMQTKNAQVRGIFRWKDMTFQWAYLGYSERKSRNQVDPIRLVCSPRFGSESSSSGKLVVETVTGLPGRSYQVLFA